MECFAAEKQCAHAELAALCEEPLRCYSTHALGLAVKPTALKKLRREKKLRLSTSHCGLETAFGSDATALASLPSSAEREESGYKSPSCLKMCLWVARSYQELPPPSPSSENSSPRCSWLAPGPSQSIFKRLEEA